MYRRRVWHRKAGSYRPCQCHPLPFQGLPGVLETGLWASFTNGCVLKVKKADCPLTSAGAPAGSERVCHSKKASKTADQSARSGRRLPAKHLHDVVVAGLQHAQHASAVAAHAHSTQEHTNRASAWQRDANCVSKVLTELTKKIQVHHLISWVARCSAV
jgi:hypothetical protein